jgi:hypothetical protein
MPNLYARVYGFDDTIKMKWLSVLFLKWITSIWVSYHSLLYKQRKVDDLFIHYVGLYNK